MLLFFSLCRYSFSQSQSSDLNSSLNNLIYNLTLKAIPFSEWTWRKSKISKTKLLQRQQQQKRDYNGSFWASLNSILNLAWSRQSGKDVWSHVSTIEARSCDIFLLRSPTCQALCLSARDLVFTSTMNNDFTFIDCTVYQSRETINQGSTLWWEMGHLTVAPLTIIVLSLGVILNPFLINNKTANNRI